MALVGTFCVVGTAYVRAELPVIHSLSDYAPRQASRVITQDGQLIGQFYNERRTVVPFSRIPLHVVHAFLAAEDAAFYSHEGIDYWGIVRAVLKNLRPGAHLQGASTITQ
ncbi:MAG: penicillin-binding protein, partial [Cytophagaceae bacterium]